MGLTFAEQQMMKMGWKPGMGLGKNNDGMASPIKAKRFSKNLGLGHDVTKNYTHWWDFAYNKAITQVEVSKNDGGEVEVSSAANDSLDQFKPNYARSARLEDNFTKGKDLKPLKESSPDSTEEASDSSEEESEEESTLVNNKGLILEFGDELFNYCGRTTGHRAGRFVNFNSKLNRDFKEPALHDVKKELKSSSDFMSERCRKLYNDANTNTPIRVGKFTRMPKKGGTQIGFSYENTEVSNDVKQEKKRKKVKLDLTDEQINQEIRILFLSGDCTEKLSDKISETPRKRKKSKNRHNILEES